MALCSGPVSPQCTRGHLPRRFSVCQFVILEIVHHLITIAQKDAIQKENQKPQVREGPVHPTEEEEIINWYQPCCFKNQDRGGDHRSSQSGCGPEED